MRATPPSVNTNNHQSRVTTAAHTCHSSSSAPRSRYRRTPSSCQTTHSNLTEQSMASSGSSSSSSATARTGAVKTPHIPPAPTVSAHMMDSRFSCNICLDPVEEPVVTQCGHLYCWPCLYQWLEPGMNWTEKQSLNSDSSSNTSLLPPSQVDPSRRKCPVCKGPCSVLNLVPIYVRGTPILGNSAGAETIEEHPEQTTVTGTAAAARPNTTTSCSAEVDNHSAKVSSSSTIATEQEFEDDDEDEEEEEDEHDQGMEVLSQSPQGDSSSSSVAAADAVAPSTPVASFRALQRTRQQDFPTPVPARPVGEPRRRALSENAVGALQQAEREHQALDPYYNNRTLALTQGLALSLHRALQPTTHHPRLAGVGTTDDPQSPPPVVIPRLHRQQGHGNAAAANVASAAASLQETDPDATEFLSRILLMLASFVILCFLLF